MTENQVDVAIIGGGIVGTTAAYFLARRGARIALIERDQLGQGTTARSFAWINASSKIADEPYHKLNALGASIYHDLADELGAEKLGLHRTGMLQCISRKDLSGLAALEEQAGYLERYGYPHRRIDADTLSALEPAIAFDEDATAIHAMSEDWLDAPEFVAFLAEEIRAMGSQVLEGCTATALDLDDEGSVCGLLTDQGTLSTSRVLIAAGHETPEVLAALTGYEAFAARFPMNRVPGLLVTTPPDRNAEALRHVIYFDGRPPAFHIRPAGNGRLRLGADDTDGMIAEDTSPENLVRAGERLLDHARARVPELIGDVTAEQCDLAVGIRPYPHDGKTLAGALPGSEGLYLIATHSGITLAPSLGQLMAEMIIDGKVPEALQPFSLERFPGFA